MKYGWANSYSSCIHDQSILCSFEEHENGNIVGISMEEIFAKYKINDNSKYLIKSDCEGAESDFINNSFCEKIIQNAEVFFMEVHFNSPHTPGFKTKWEEYNLWINKFAATHKIEYFVSNKNRGYGHYLLYKINI